MIDVLIKPQKARDHVLDILRSMAIVMVIIAHVSSAMLPLHQRSIVSAIGSLGVPIFVMLTGYLMVDRDYSGDYLKRFVRSNLLPLFVCLEAWNFIIYIINSIINNHFSFNSLVKTLKIAFFIGATGSYFWFMPMIFGLYLGLPIFASFIKKLFSDFGSHKLYIYTLMVALIYFGTIIPTIQQLLGIAKIKFSISSVLNLNIFGSNVWGGSVWAIYLVLGFLMKKMTFGRIPSSVLLIIFLGSFCASSFLRYLEFCRTGTASAAYGSGFVIIPAFSLFLFLLRFRGKIDKVPHIVVVFFTNISLYAFSIYMIHIWVKDVLQKCFITYNVDIYNTGLFYVPTIVLTILISLGIALAISRVTFLRKWLLLVK